MGISFTLDHKLTWESEEVGFFSKHLKEIEQIEEAAVARVRNQVVLRNLGT